MRRISAESGRERLAQLKIELMNTRVPNVSEGFRHGNMKALDEEMCKGMIEKMTFSSFEDMRVDGTIALDALMLNPRNVEHLKDCGSLGAIIDLLRRINIEKNPKSEHVATLIQCLHSLTIGEDRSIPERIMSNPYGVQTILKLCKHTHGKVQLYSFEILNALVKLDGGLRELVRKGLIDTLMSPEMLYKNTTAREVRHGSAQMVQRITAIMPEQFPLEAFIDHALDDNGNRRLDCHQEIFFLHGLHIFWSRLNNEGRKLPMVFSLMAHLLEELITETFENLDHCVLIMKCLVLASQDTKQIRFMLDHDLALALQYLAKTDFTLYRKKMGKRLDPAHFRRKANLSGAIQLGPSRTPGTLAALAIVKPQDKKAESRNYEDINVFATKSLVTIYEHLIEYRLDIISNILSSGLIPAFVARVGHGSDKDIRFLKVVVQFLDKILKKVLSTQPNGESHMSIAHEMPRPKSYVRIGESFSMKSISFPDEEEERGLGGLSGRRGGGRKMPVSDLKSITNTIHYQGVTDLLLGALGFHDDIGTVQKALRCLAIMDFEVIRADLYQPLHIRRIFGHNTTRAEWYFPSLTLICAMVQANDVQDEVLLSMAFELKGLDILMHALKLSSWEFAFKGDIYDCISRLAHLKGFRNRLWEISSMSVLILETRARIYNMKAVQRGRKKFDFNFENGAYEATNKLADVLREDIAASKIQNVARGKLSRWRMQKRAARSKQGGRIGSRSPSRQASSKMHSRSPSSRHLGSMPQQRSRREMFF